MEMKYMRADQFEAVANLTLEIYAKKDALTGAKTLNEKLTLKREIQQLVNERTRISQED